MTESLKNLSQAELIRQINEAFKNYNSVLALARSSLADSALIKPLLILDDVSPTANERGNALRLLLTWATSKLAPAATRFPIGQERPLDDPTWRDPRWWRYNILRHRYLEPLHPDDFVEGGRFTETLVALTGIPSVDTLYDERNRAIREVAEWLQQQVSNGQATSELRQLALDRIYSPLSDRPSESKLLDIASTFEDVFPRTLLLQMAQHESISNPESILERLIAQRILLTADVGATLLLSPILQQHIWLRQPAQRSNFRHKLAAEFYINTQETLKAVAHLIYAQEWKRAATIAMQLAQSSVEDHDTEDVCTLLEKFTSTHLPTPVWCELQIMLSDLLVATGQHEKALLSCRNALTSTDALISQARIYRRMGKLYEKHNQLHALGYYEQAFIGFERNDLELYDLLKDRAWLHILRQDWQSAESDLQLALEREEQMTDEQKADIYDAMANLHRHQKNFESALSFARKSLTLRERSGNLGRVAASFGNLGLLYTALGEYDHAIVAHSEAMSTFQLLGRQDECATTLLNLGTVRYLNKQIKEAIAHYQQSVTICQQIPLPLVEVRGHYNLSEAFAELGQDAKAQKHWQISYELSEKCGFDDELTDLLALQSETPALQTSVESLITPDKALVRQSISLLDPEEKSILHLTQNEGRLTVKTLMASLHVSKATANRRLAALVQNGNLIKYGKGRGTYYALPPVEVAQSAKTRPEDTLSPPAENGPEWQVIQEQLERQLVHLQREYFVHKIGLIRSIPIRLVVDFHEEPDLSHFFELEQELVDNLKMEIDLILAESARYRSVLSEVEIIQWIDILPSVT